MFSKRTKPPVWQVIYGDFIYVFPYFPIKTSMFDDDTPEGTHKNHPPAWSASSSV